MLTGLNFPPRFADWVMKCVTTTSFSIVINGQSHGFFPAKRGLRQGDPLSPLLFTIFMEYLSRLLSEACEYTGFTYHPLCKSLKLSHLMFADELLLFFRGDIRSVLTLMTVFQCFSAASGLSISNEKSNIILNGIAREYEIEILAHTGFKKDKLPFKYLGVQISHKRLTKLNCNILVDKMVARIRGWNKRKISYSGRLVNFLWEWDDSYSKAPLVAWNTLCKGKLFGGLGIVDTKQWNIDAVGKLVWWIARKKDHLWIQWVDKVYIKQTDWMDYKPTSASSWAWRKVCEIKEIFKTAYVQGKWSSDDENYKISDGYNWLTQHDMDRVPWFKSVWNKFIIPKHSFILWLLNQERLLTLDRLVKMGITQQTSCFLCGIHAENHRQLFQECVYARQCYTQLFAWLQMQVPVHLSAASLLKIRKHTGFIRFLLSSLVAAMQYHIWLCRNTCRVDGYVIHPVAILKRIMSDCRMRLMSVSVGSLKRAEIDWCT
ncbi:uncharacterized protein LOC141618709 [Silene latifolia]|uniref:uncharacterized protein LOC141618709 n=1 Tax=Silene latifolia TaxID=37657 RepID=UPI003D7873A9